MTVMTRRAWLAALSLCLLAASPVAAAGRVILTVTVGATAKDFTAEEIAALPQVEIKTITPWTEGVHSYRGPALATLLATAGQPAAGGTIEMKALNDYKVTVPVADVASYQPIVALTADGKPMPVRDKGPLWLIYPLSSNSAANVPEIHSRMIWQLRAITAQ